MTEIKVWRCDCCGKEERGEYRPANWMIYVLHKGNVLYKENKSGDLCKECIEHKFPEITDAVS